MIRAIIFDCFGVLTTEGWLAFKQRYFGNDPRLSSEASDLRRQVDSGLLGYGDFVHQITRLAGVSEREFRSAIEHNAPNEELFVYIEHFLKPKYKIGLLSNAGSDRLEDMFGAARAGLFDEVSLSFTTGATKPQQESYIIIADQLGVEPGECAFIDDQVRHCTGALAAGMQAIVYKDFEQFRMELSALLSRDI